MNEWKCRVEIEASAEKVMELRLFDAPDNGRHLTWNIPLSEAQDLASWWEEELTFETRRFPLKDLRYRGIEISMYSPALVQIKGFDAYGSSRIVGWSLPTPVVEALLHYFSVLKEPSCQFHSTRSQERGATAANARQTAAPTRSAMTNRVAVYFFDPSQHRLRYSGTPRCLVAKRKQEGGHIPCCRVN